MNVILSVSKQNRTFSTHWQASNSWQLLFCTNGSGHLAAKTQTLDFTHNDIIVVPPNTSYTASSQTGFSGIHITMDDILLSASQMIKMHETAAKFLSTIMGQIYYVYNNEIPNKTLLMENYGGLISNLLISMTGTKTFSPAVDHIRIACVRHFTEPDLDLNTLFEAEHAYNTNYLKKLFTKEVGISPQQFLIKLRMDFAQKVLSNIGNTKFSISQIALACGYEDALYFSRVFKATTGSSPKAYIKMNQHTAGKA